MVSPFLSCAGRRAGAAPALPRPALYPHGVLLPGGCRAQGVSPAARQGTGIFGLFADGLDAGPLGFRELGILSPIGELTGAAAGRLRGHRGGAGRGTTGGGLLPSESGKPRPGRW
jgi:hypothetical protein